MLIKYEWNNVECNVPNNSGSEPHTHKETRTIRYYYDHDINADDVIAYLMPYDLTHTREKTKDQVNEIGLANFYMAKMIDYLLENTYIDLEDLESDTYFVEFMRERYEQDAWEDWERYNDEY